MSVRTALDAIITVVSAVSGIRQAPTNPTDNPSIYPFAVAYVMDGKLINGAIGTRKHLVNIATELLTARKDLARDMALITPYVDSIPSAFIAQVSDSGGRFGGTISAIGDISYELLPEVNYANVQMIGYRFTMTNVKILENTA
jgi:hypothetical protein